MSKITFLNTKNNNSKSDNNKNFPYEIINVDPQTTNKLLKDFSGERTGFVQVGPKKYFFPYGYKKNAANYYNFNVRPDDIWIVTFPRSGTTWTQEMVWLLCNNLNFEKAQKLRLSQRFPFFEFSTFIHPKVKDEILWENRDNMDKLKLIEELSMPAYKYLDNINENRFIKTHLPFSLLPPDLLTVGCKVIYLARNPKDVAVSFYHLNRLFKTQGYKGDFSKYWDYFENNLQPWTPYWDHLQEGWDRRNEKNVLFFFYEDLNKVNLGNSIKKVSDFLNVHYTDEQMKLLENHLQIDNFRNNKSVNSDEFKDSGFMLKNESEFIRNGKTGGWKDYFNDDLNERANKWIEKHLLNTDLRFPNN